MATTTDLVKLMPKMAEDLLEGGGAEFVETIGLDATREVVHAVFCGENLRDSTEPSTRRRLSLANASLVALLVRGSADIEDFIQNLSSLAADQLRSTTSKSARWVLQWVLGLTGKGVQNILRDDPNRLTQYCATYDGAINEAIETCESQLGQLTGQIELSPDLKAPLTWAFMLYLLAAAGAQTLTLRGSEKSIYGKLFERLVLGSLLHILGYRLVDPETNTSFDKVFWLSGPEEKRESDAILIDRAGVGVRFDIGFIGRGNPEIILDKVSRFEREMEYGRERHYMATFIVVDRIGRRSRIVDLAREIDGTVIQMSMAFWPLLVARKLHESIGFEHELVNMPTSPASDISEYLKVMLTDAPMMDFIR